MGGIVKIAYQLEGQAPRCGWAVGPVGISVVHWFAADLGWGDLIRLDRSFG